jgi:hypothetical protein
VGWFVGHAYEYQRLFWIRSGLWFWLLVGRIPSQRNLLLHLVSPGQNQNAKAEWRQSGWGILDRSGCGGHGSLCEPESMSMIPSPNKRASGKGGIPSLFHVGRARLALPEHER